MADWYKIEYEDVEGAGILVGIRKVDGVDSNPTTIQGYVNVNTIDINDPFTVIRPTKASIYLEASLDNSLDNLFAENEREWEVEIYRSDPDINFPKLMFQGWLLPDGVYEDYVRVRWLIEMTAECGLASLANKAYVDSNGDKYEGREDLRTIIERCLKRTGFDHVPNYQVRNDTNDNFPVEMQVAFPGAKADFFDQTVDQRVFVSSDGKTSLSCKAVLENILGSCNAYVFGWSGKWYINWVLQHANPFVDSLKYRQYIPAAAYLISTEGREVSVGPQLNGFENYWINANQRIDRRASLGAAKISRKILDVESSIINPDIENNGSTATGWTVVNGTYVVLDGESAVSILDTDLEPDPVFQSDESIIPIVTGQIVKIEIDITVEEIAAAAWFGIRVRVDAGGGTFYYMTNSGDWITSPTGQRIVVNDTPNAGTYKYDSAPVPEGGTISIGVFTLDDFDTELADEAILSRISIAIAEQNQPESEDHLASRMAKPSSFTQPTRELLVGDYSTAAYIGTYRQSDGIAKTDQGYSSPSLPLPTPLYRGMVIDQLFVRSHPSRVFSGDIKGWFTPNDLIKIHGFDDIDWVITSWAWDSKKGIIKVNLFQLHWTESESLIEGGANPVLDDIDYEKIINFGETIEPTIKG